MAAEEPVLAVRPGYETIGHWMRLAAEQVEAITQALVHDPRLTALDPFCSSV